MSYFRILVPLTLLNAAARTLTGETKMDALTWFKSVFRRARAPVRADVASESWADVPLHLVAARLRPPPIPQDAVPEEIQDTPPPPTPLPMPRPKGPRPNLDIVAWNGRQQPAVPPPPPLAAHLARLPAPGKPGRAAISLFSPAKRR